MNGYNNVNPDEISEAEIGIYVQDALDELEFIMGDVKTKYGALRAALGYPQPWKINYVEVSFLLISITSHCNGKELKKNSTKYS